MMSQITSSILSSSSCIILIISLSLFITVNSFTIRDYIKASDKRTGSESLCPTWHPFQCPNGDCISLKYLCDGSPDCGDGFDENQQMCTAGTFLGHF